jgi:hypothetical protein
MKFLSNMTYFSRIYQHTNVRAEHWILPHLTICSVEMLIFLIVIWNFNARGTVRIQSHQNPLFMSVILRYTDGIHTLLPPCFRFHDVAHLHQFHQDYIRIPEDGAPNAPKHVGARYINIWLFKCILLVFLSQYEKCMVQIQNLSQIFLILRTEGDMIK